MKIRIVFNWLFLFLLVAQTGHSKNLNEKQQNLKDALNTNNIDSYFSARDRTRALIIKRANTGGVLNEAIRHDRVEDLVELPSSDILDNISDMDKPNLKSSQLETQPWSDDYWAIYKGILGARYADVEFSFGDRWNEYFQYATVLAPLSKILKETPEQINTLLSPAEKYDLLIGGQGQQTLTDYGWRQGKMYFDEYGKVETWMGICHGWAAAAYMLPRPQNAVTVKAADNKTNLTFYPSDIKALSSLLWANASPPTRFVGGRCNDKTPKKDPEGRIISQGCFDVNPGLWHKLVVNQMGVAKRSMVIDVTYDYEVWNQPMLSYTYEYFDVSKRQGSTIVSTTPDLKSALVDLDTFRDLDKYKKYRNAPTTKYLLGIQMRIAYMVENRPTISRTDDPSRDAVNYATYTYDLELDENMNILGGEWYNSTHPDFVWTPNSDGRALSQADNYFLGDPNWNGKKALPARWRQGAQQVAPSGQPLARIVESLIELSKQPQSEE